ncbi:MAG TPA: STM4015 family protein [Trebonia sp.]|nr:STM4015 family protein [Trebonia sp.]
MTVREHLDRYDGLRVIDFGGGDQPEPGERVAWRVGIDRDSWRRQRNPVRFGHAFGQFLDAVDPAAVTHLVIGAWDTDDFVISTPVLRLLQHTAPRLPNLKALFLGDIISEESEISWLRHGDITPLLQAYPGLERLDVRGGSGPGLSPISSTELKVLRFESGGLSASVVRAVGASDLPNLQTLELWLGEREYGGDTTVADLAPVLSGERLPALTRLGLMDSEIQDEICTAVAIAPVVARLSELALSMGALTDDGAEALLSGQPLTHLVELDLRHHFMTEPMVARLRESLAPVTMLLIDDAQEELDEEEYGIRLFIEVAE